VRRSAARPGGRRPYRYIALRAPGPLRQPAGPQKAGAPLAPTRRPPLQPRTSRWMLSYSPSCGSIRRSSSRCASRLASALCAPTSAPPGPPSWQGGSGSEAGAPSARREAGSWPFRAASRALGLGVAPRCAPSLQRLWPGAAAAVVAKMRSSAAAAAYPSPPLARLLRTPPTDSGVPRGRTASAATPCATAQAVQLHSSRPPRALPAAPPLPAPPPVCGRTFGQARLTRCTSMPSVDCKIWGGGEGAGAVAGAVLAGGRQRGGSC
jgi:hypothetical protein